ncbi:hypothetical protein GUF71_17095, partial [Xanthomonas citri pv. citri]|nr:hypothetical protein [Xanthomonas citri pv. citri]
LGACRTNTSGHIGVHLQKASKKYVAKIGISNKQHYLGCYDTQEEAVAAYLAAKKVIHTFQPVPRDKDNG